MNEFRQPPQTPPLENDFGHVRYTSEGIFDHHCPDLAPVLQSGRQVNGNRPTCRKMVCILQSKKFKEKKSINLFFGKENVPI